MLFLICITVQTVVFDIIFKIDSNKEIKKNMDKQETSSNVSIQSYCFFQGRELSHLWFWLLPISYQAINQLIDS